MAENIDYLKPREANYSALNPIQFLSRSAAVYPEHTAIVYGDKQFTWQQTLKRCKQLASALQKIGIQKGHTVSYIAANTPELYEAHFGVPMLGAVLNAINCRLDSDTIAYILEHSECKVLVCDREFSDVVSTAIQTLASPPIIIDIDDPKAPAGTLIGQQEYEAFIATGDPEFSDYATVDDWDNLSLNYTSGTTGKPKGVLYHYRGAYLTAMSNILEWDMPKHATYLWSLPMFHCNGWCFPWSVAARAGTNVCMRKVNGANIYHAIAENKVDHFCGAPTVLSMVMGVSETERREFDHTCKVMTAAAPPPASVLQKMQQQGFEVTHVYGLTETYGPATVCAWQSSWDRLPLEEQAAQNARQGVNYTVGES
ncbi:MAG: fatty-acyl-CoA synthase, partial [Parvicella sp.]